MQQQLISKKSKNKTLNLIREKKIKLCKKMVEN